jgi:AraC-like DNA-binding protein/DNA gyrase inhibitor GyrI
MDAVQRAIDYIEEHLYEPLELERIAGAAAMSLPNLYRLFYALTGHPIKDYIRKRRTSEAARQLRRSNMPVLDTALDCGFDTYQAFTRTFKKLTGLTPGMYRRSELIYSFERITVGERTDYLEDRELSDRFPDVRVYRIGPQRMNAYDYRTGSPHPEEEAFRFLHERLAALGIEGGRVRVFGCNQEQLDADGTYTYRIMALDEKRELPEEDGWFGFTSEESLYAVSRIPYGEPAHILRCWNQVLAEWLPRSAFILGSQPYLEEYVHENGKIVRMKLCLPVRRKQEQENIDIVRIPPVRTIGFRAEGTVGSGKADERLIRWMEEQVYDAEPPLQLYMTCTYGMPHGPDSWHELGLVWPDGLPLPLVPEYGHTTGQGGLYARMRTGAYGEMTGVLDRLYRWLSQSDRYISDGSRAWFARYVPGDASDLERTTVVECFIPITPIGGTI